MVATRFRSVFHRYRTLKRGSVPVVTASGLNVRVRRIDEATWVLHNARDSA